MTTSEHIANHHTQSSGKTGGIFILTEDYQRIYSKELATIKGRHKSFEQLKDEVLSKGYFYGSAYTDGFKEEGVPASQCIARCEALQARWALENGVELPPQWLNRFILRGAARRLLGIDFPTKDEIYFKIITAQIKKARPRILWVFSGVYVTKTMLKEWREHVERIVLWHSCPLWPGYPFKSYDAIFSSIQSLVDHFNSEGIKSFHLPHAFDKRILDSVSLTDKREAKAVFAGSLGGIHQERTAFIDALARRIEIDYYGPSLDGVPTDSPLRHNYRGPAWGLNLYRVYGSYQVALHVNIRVSGRYPSAKRLFETTGMGTCLLTDHHENLKDLFEPGAEVVAFDDMNDCAAKIEALLHDPALAQQIGQRAQVRTLKEHTYKRRIQYFISICQNELGIRFQ